MEDERNTQSHQAGGEVDQVEVTDRGLFDKFIGKKKKEEDKKQEEVLVTGMEKVSVEEPEVKEEHQDGEKKESLFSKLQRSSSSSCSSSDEEEEVIDDNGEVIKRKKKKGLKEKIKEKLPGHEDTEGEHLQSTDTPIPYTPGIRLVRTSKARIRPGYAWDTYPEPIFKSGYGVAGYVYPVRLG